MRYAFPRLTQFRHVSFYKIFCGKMIFRPTHVSIEPFSDGTIQVICVCFVFKEYSAHKLSMGRLMACQYSPLTECFNFLVVIVALFDTLFIPSRYQRENVFVLPMLCILLHTYKIYKQSKCAEHMR